MLHYPSMRDVKPLNRDDSESEDLAAEKQKERDQQKELDRAKYSPREVSEERFTKEQLKHAKYLVEVFATPETRKRLRDTAWGDEPETIQAGLDFGDRMNAEVKGAAEDIKGGLGYKDMADDTIKNFHRGFTDEIESAIDRAKDT